MPVNPLEDFINEQRQDFDAELPAGIWDRINKDLGPLDGERNDRAPRDESRRAEDDDLETFVKTHRPAFDHAEAPEHGWAMVRAQLPGRLVRMIPRSRLHKYRIAAAAAVVLLVCTLFLGREIGLRSLQQQELAAIEAVAPDFSEMENYYRDEINRSFKLVSQYNDDPTLKADLAAIDEAMGELREQISEVPREERATLIANLIESYQIKLQILQQILDKLPPAAVERGSAKTNENETISL